MWGPLAEVARLPHAEASNDKRNLPLTARNMPLQSSLSKFSHISSHVTGAAGELCHLSKLGYVIT